MSSHVIITGTGRAGTSFLVEFLDACGLDAGDLATSYYFDGAHAGYEHRPGGANLPYVIKNPLLHEHLDDPALLELGVDAVIIPVRDLRAAARSRILQERAAAGWSIDRSSHYETISSGTPGGAYVSLSLDDQERLLAVGQARIIQWAVASDHPLVLLDFPRIVDDAEYCVDRLWSVLERFCTRERALEAHAEVARPERIRVRHRDVTTDPAELQLRIDSLEKAIADLHEAGAGPITNLRTMLAIDQRSTQILKAVRRVAKGLGLTESEG